VIVALILAFVLPPQYRSTVLLAPARHAGADGSMNGALPGGALSLLQGLQMPQENLTAEAIAILQSRQFVERFIVKHDLLPLLFADRWDAAQRRWTEEAPALEDGYLRFTRAVLKVRTDDETGFVKVQIHYGSAAEATQWANELVRDLNDEIRERVVSEGNADLKYLYARMAETLLPEIRSGIANLIRERTQEVMLATNRESYAFRVLEEAVASKYRYFPKRALILIAGFIVGVLVTLAIVAVKESLAAESAA
jgi:LPS O-antigen subunit length determinant protein (WzzB/FepE family)